MDEKFGNTIIANVSSHDNPGAKGNFAIIDLTKDSIINVEWHDTRETLEKDSLEQLHGIGPTKAEKLKKSIVSKISQLAKYENLAELAQLSELSEEQLREFQLKAKSWINKEIYQIAPFDFHFEKMILYDIETDIAQERVWLIGLQIDEQFIQLFAKNWEQEKDILMKFIEILENNPDHVLIYYSGNSFDHEVLVKAMRRHEINTEIMYSHIHIDLGVILKRCFIFPIRYYKLKNLGSSLGYPFKHTNLDGYAVAMSYHSHVEDGKALDPKIFEYNEDDVKAIQFLIERNIPAEAKIDKDFFHEAYTFKYPLKDGSEKNELIIQVRNFYDNSSSNIRNRKDKGAEIRLSAKNLQELSVLRDNMDKLGFRAGKPQKKSVNRWYIPYYGKQQVIRFVEMIKPRKKYDISSLLSKS